MGVPRLKTFFQFENRKPVLGLFGSHDTSHVKADIPVLQSSYRASELIKVHIIPHARHPCYLDDPNTFNTLLLEWLEQVFLLQLVTTL